MGRNMLKALGQGLVVAAIVAGAVIGWARWVPASHALLTSVGLRGALERVGVEFADPIQPGGGQRGGFGGAVTVVIAPVQEGEMRDQVAAIGTGQALHSVILSPEVSGRMAAIEVSSGDYVARGAVVARLDDAAERIARDRAEILLEEARTTADRLARLQASGTATEVQIREAALGVRTAELGVRQAEFDLSRRQLVAPISGWIGIIDAEVGDQVNTATAVTRIDDRSTILVDFRVPERLVGRIQPGDALDVALLVQPDRPLPGRVRAVDSRVEETSRSLRVLAEVPNPDDRLRAGMAFSIAMNFPGEPLPAVDPLSIQWGNDGAFVWVVRDGRVARVPVRIMQRSETLVLVRGALEPGEGVVREGVQSLRDGTEVREREPVAPVGASGISSPETPQAQSAADASET